MDQEPRRRAGKKLIDAARYWASGGTSNEEAISDLKAFGAPQEVIDEMVVAQKNDDFEVLQENWHIIEMWLRMQTQWRATHGVLIGLDYNVAKWLFDVYQVTDHKEMIEALMIMERTALEAINEERRNGG